MDQNIRKPLQIVEQDFHYIKVVFIYSSDISHLVFCCCCLASYSVVLVLFLSLKLERILNGLSRYSPEEVQRIQERGKQDLRGRGNESVVILFLLTEFYVFFSLL